MGQAKKRGSFEERKGLAAAKDEAERKARMELEQAPGPRPDNRIPGRAFPMFVAAAAALASFEMPAPPRALPRRSGKRRKG